MDFIQKAEDFVFALFKDKLSAQYTYHTLRVTKAFQKITAREKLLRTSKIHCF